MNNTQKERDQDKYEKAEKELKLKLVEFTERPEIQSQTAEAYYIWKDDPNMIIEFSSEDDIDDHTFTRFMDWFMFDFRSLDQKERVIDLFSKDDNTDLSGYEKSLLSDWMNSYQSFYELKEKKGTDCILEDLFTGKKLTVRDRNASQNAGISDILFARPLKTGHIHYFSGAVSIYPNLFKQTIIDYFNDEYEQYKNQTGNESGTEIFLRDWSYIIANRLEDVVKHPQFLTRDGEEFILSTAFYRTNNPEQAADKLVNTDMVREITDSGTAFRAFLIENRKDGYTANVEIENDSLAVKCNSRNKLEKAREIVENLLVGSLEHLRDDFKELNSFMKKEASVSGDKDRLPSNNIPEDELYNELDSYYENWLYTPLAALDGLTPVKAMGSAKGKEKLENILKELESIYEHARKVGEPYYDIRKLRDKLKRRTG